MIALHQNVANCQNTLTVLTLRRRIFLQDVWVSQMCMQHMPHNSHRMIRVYKQEYNHGTCLVFPWIIRTFFICTRSSTVFSCLIYQGVSKISEKSMLEAVNPSFNIFKVGYEGGAILESDSCGSKWKLHFWQICIQSVFIVENLKPLSVVHWLSLFWQSCNWRSVILMLHDLKQIWKTSKCNEQSSGWWC